MKKKFADILAQKISSQTIKILLDQVAKDLPRMGFALRLYSTDALEKLTALPVDTQTNILNSLKFRLSILCELEINNKDLDCDLVQHALQKMKLTCDKNFLDTIKLNDIVEVYSLANIQAFANFEFFRYCSYSLLDLAVNTWDTLFHRQENVTHELYAKIGKLMTDGNKTESYEVRPHVVKERISEEQKSFLIYMGKMTPVYSADGARYGMIHTLRVKELTPREITSISLDN